MDIFDTARLYDSLQVMEREQDPLGREERLKAMEKPLLAWYGSRARSLPWRDDPKPYRVWTVSYTHLTLPTTSRV